MTAPLALFAFNRPGHLGRTLQALAANRGASSLDIVAFSDGPRSAVDMAAVAAVRDLLGVWQDRGVFRSFRVIAQERNFGLAASIITGVTAMCREHDRVIVLEDDMVTSPHFLAYMREGLEMYANDERVASLHGYAFPMRENLPETYFLAGADCWGWATWRRAWSRFEPDGSLLLAELERRRACYAFDIDGAHPFTRMLKRQIRGLNNSWAIRWKASAYLAGMVSLHPHRSLVANIGHDGTGAHCHSSASFDVELAANPIRLLRMEATEMPEARRALGRYFRSIAGPLGRVRRSVADIGVSLRRLVGL